MEKVFKRKMLEKRKFESYIDANDITPFLNDKKMIELFKLALDLDFVDCEIGINQLRCSIPFDDELRMTTDFDLKKILISVRNLGEYIPQKAWRILDYAEVYNRQKVKFIKPEELKQELLRYTNILREYDKELGSNHERITADLLKEYLEEELEGE